MIGEIRDLETLDVALKAAGTGHLVFSTLHTTDATLTINRVLSFYPPHQQNEVRFALANALEAVVSLRLVPRRDQPGRVPACEVLVNTAAVRDQIRDLSATLNIPGPDSGRQRRLRHADVRPVADDWYSKGVISYENALFYATNPRGVRAARSRASMAPATQSWDGFKTSKAVDRRAKRVGAAGASAIRALKKARLQLDLRERGTSPPFGVARHVGTTAVFTGVRHAVNAAVASRMPIPLPDDMFKKVLIANRGEIALRVIRACRELDIQTVAVYSEADRESLHVRFADDDVCIGPPPGRESYLKIPRLIAAAEITGADAIHPGYGFSRRTPSSRKRVARRASRSSVRRPSRSASWATRRLRARDERVGVPIVPGTPGPVEDVDEALEYAKGIGFPVIIKAAAGGGGKGMRVARDADDFARSFQLARSPKRCRAFGNGDVYVEKFLERPRHVEFQVLGDTTATSFTSASATARCSVATRS